MSVSTVSNVINNTKLVSDEIKIKINKVIAELNYEENPVARSLKNKRRRTSIPTTALRRKSILSKYPRATGFDNTFEAFIAEPSFTAVMCPNTGWVATVELLVNKIAKPSSGTGCAELPVNFLIRQSIDLRGDKNWDLYGCKLPAVKYYVKDLQ